MQHSHTLTSGHWYVRSSFRLKLGFVLTEIRILLPSQNEEKIEPPITYNNIICAPWKILNQCSITGFSKAVPAMNCGDLMPLWVDFKKKSLTSFGKGRASYSDSGFPVYRIIIIIKSPWQKFKQVSTMNAAKLNLLIHGHDKYNYWYQFDWITSIMFDYYD